MNELTVKPVTMTDRQLAIVGLIARGKSYDEMGEVLGIAGRTAKAHADAVRHKLGVAKKRQIPSAYRTITGYNPFEIDVEELVAA